MNRKLENIKDTFKAELDGFSKTSDLEKIKVKYLGKKSELNEILRSIGKLPSEERPALGELVNEVRTFIADGINKKKNALQEKEISEKIKREKIDITEPGKERTVGNRHPLNIVAEDMCNIFRSMGFSVVDGPEIETDYYNFEALNMPSYHPARDTQDTFYIDENLLLRTQTTCVQVRILEKEKPPVRVVCPGKVFRSDDVDATHSPVFHQLEGLVVDEGISFSDLKGTLELFMKELYGNSAKVRFRPHHFPYTEPSAEMDIQCFSCKGKGCRVCKNEGYIEILGCGMVHPAVLERCGINSEKYTGLAFGIGIERVAMKKYGVNDMRLFYENDVRFLKQFV
jgi:phenylalanyl-tRNA synthetase alpha chain